MASSTDIQHSILDMQAKRSKLGARKQNLQFEISKIKEMLRYVKEGETMHELVAKKKEFIAETNEIEAQLSELKIALKKRELLKDEVKEMEAPKAKTIALKAELIVLRDHYLNFAGDKTRVASMRAMSAEFAEKLTKLIKKS